MRQPDLRLQAQQRVLGIEDVEAGDRRRAGERVAREGMAVEEAAAVLVLAGEAGVHALGRQRGGERQVAAGQPLAEAEEVRGDALLLAGEHRPGAPEPGCDLVADQQHVVDVAQLAHPAQEAGRLNADSRRALDQRLDDHRGDLLAVQLEQALERRRIPGRRAVGAEQQRLVDAVKELDSAD